MLFEKGGRSLFINFAVSEERRCSRVGVGEGVETVSRFSPYRSSAALKSRGVFAGGLKVMVRPVFPRQYDPAAARSFFSLSRMPSICSWVAFRQVQLIGFCRTGLPGARRSMTILRNERILDRRNYVSR